MLHGLAIDLVQGQYADKERAVAMLSSMTMYIDHHDVLLESGVLPALMSAVSNPKVEPTVNLAVASCNMTLPHGPSCISTPQAFNVCRAHCLCIPCTPMCNLRVYILSMLPCVPAAAHAYAQTEAFL